jgi:fructose-1-phosphate kinase PfkB-like protein
MQQLPRIAAATRAPRVDYAATVRDSRQNDMVAEESAVVITRGTGVIVAEALEAFQRPPFACTAAPDL